MKNNLVFENHDAYLLYNAALKKNPELPAHGSVSVQYALYLYYKAYPDVYKRQEPALCRLIIVFLRICCACLMISSTLFCCLILTPPHNSISGRPRADCPPSTNKV